MDSLPAGFEFLSHILLVGLISVGGAIHFMIRLGWIGGKHERRNGDATVRDALAELLGRREPANDADMKIWLAKIVDSQTMTIELVKKVIEYLHEIRTDHRLFDQRLQDMRNERRDTGRFG